MKQSLSPASKEATVAGHHQWHKPPSPSNVKAEVGVGQGGVGAGYVHRNAGAHGDQRGHWIP